MLALVGTNRIGGSMAVNRDEFLAELERLTDQEIEARLPLWDREQLMLVQQYIDRREFVPPEQASKASEPSSEQLRASEQSEASEPAHNPSIADRITRETTVAALAVARKASTMATSALILSVGAMLTAIVAGAIAYLSLKN